MKFGKYIWATLSITIVFALGIVFFVSKQSDAIRDMIFTKDFDRIDALFHKGDNWYWMISDYSRQHGYDLEHTLKYKTSSSYEKRHDLITKVFETDNQIAGFMAYYPKSLYTWQFLFLLVDQDFRGKGLAKKLLKYAVNDMVKLGAIKIDLVTRVDNARAQGLYQNFGFKVTKITEEHVHMTWRKN